MSPLSVRSGLMRSGIVLSLLVAVALLPDGSALAQEKQQEPDYEVLTVDPLRRRDTNIAKILRGDMPLEGYERDFDAYFTEYVFAEMTQPEFLSQLPKLRQTFIARWSRNAKDPKVAAHLNRLALNTMKRMMAGNFHPTVRYNAALLVGDLDLQPGVEVGDRTPPIPLPDGLETLLTALQHPRLPDAVKVGALVGMVRHAKYRMPAENRDKLSAAMLNLLNQSDPPGDRSREGHEWMRRRAIEVLATLRNPASLADTAAALAAVVADENASLTLRCAAAEGLGKLPLDATAPFDPAALSKNLGELALAACRSERDTLASTNRLLAARRQLAVYMVGIQGGLKAPVAKDPQNAVAAGVKKEVDNVLLAIKDSADVQGLGEQLSASCTQLAAVLRPGTAPPAPAPSSEATTPTAAKKPPAKPAQPNVLNELDGLE